MLVDFVRFWWIFNGFWWMLVDFHGFLQETMETNTETSFFLPQHIWGLVQIFLATLKVSHGAGCFEGEVVEHGNKPPGRWATLQTNAMFYQSQQHPYSGNIEKKLTIGSGSLFFVLLSVSPGPVPY